MLVLSVTSFSAAGKTDMKKIIKPLLKILLVTVVAVGIGYFVYVGTLI